MSTRTDAKLRRALGSPAQIETAQSKTLEAIGRLREATGRLGAAADQSTAMLAKLAEAITDVLNTGADLALAVGVRDCRTRRKQIQHESRKAELRRRALAQPTPKTARRRR